MATKKSPQKAAPKLPSISAKIDRLIPTEGDGVRAIASVNIGGAYPFEIKEDGEIVKAAMTNERIPEVPQTGDESNIGFWIGLAAVALGGVIATAIVLIKKKKDDENE